MGTSFLLGQIKKQASSFLHEKYKIARIALTDVTEAELLAEEATNNDQCSPDARTMTKIAAASFDTDNYWRIVDILHRKLDNEEWKSNWRQSYKALVLLEFLLTHGPEDFADEFLYDLDAIQELGTFQYVDDKGFDWGVHMQSRADHIQNLLLGREELEQARRKALKITKEIKGFGNSNDAVLISPTSSSSSTSFPFSTASPISSSDPFSTASSDSTANGEDAERKSDRTDETHVWDRRHPVWETGSLIEDQDEEKDIQEEEMTKDGLIGGICSKLVGFSPLKKFHGGRAAAAGFKTLSNVEKVSRERFDRQNSRGY